MLQRYEKFLKEFDEKLQQYFLQQGKYIKCKKGCSSCCQNGDYPFSRLEMEYLMNIFQNLDKNVQDKIRKNISEIKNKTSYACPFLIDNLCSVYQRRGLVCRTHGLAYLENGNVKLPQCANDGKNYSEIFDKRTKEITIDNPIKENLRIDAIFNSDMAQKYNLEKGEIRKLIDWF